MEAAEREALITARCSPFQTRRIENRSIDAHPAVVPAVGCFYLRHATEADADAAGHWRLQRYVATDAPVASPFRQSVQHGFRSAADQVVGRTVRCQQLRHKAALPQAAIVAGQM